MKAYIHTKPYTKMFTFIIIKSAGKNKSTGKWIFKNVVFQLVNG